MLLGTEISGLDVLRASHDLWPGDIRATFLANALRELAPAVFFDDGAEYVFV